MPVSTMVSMKSWTVSFEYVSASACPEYYCCCPRRHPIVQAVSVPSCDWTPVAVTHTNHPDAVYQVRALRHMERTGLLIRSVVLAPGQQDAQQHAGAGR